MSLDISQLPEWHDVDNSLTIKALTTNRFSSIPNIHLVPDVLGSIEVPFLYSNPIFTNIVCNTTSSGSTTLGTKEVKTCFINSREAICAGGIQGTTLSKYMKNLNDLPFEAQIAEEFAKQIEKFTEKILINGSPLVATDGVLCNGLLYALNTASASTINMTATAITNSNATSVFDGYLSNQLPIMREMDRIYALVDFASFGNLMVDLRNKDYVNFKTEDDGSMEVKLPGYSNVYVRGLATMPANKVVITYPENFIQAFYLKNSIDMFYDKVSKSYIKDAEFRLGLNLHFPDHVIYAK